MIRFRMLATKKYSGPCMVGTLLLLWVLAPAAWAARLILKIQAANPSDHVQPVEIRTSLPERITTNDIINLAGLNLGYDVKSDTYYVYGTLELRPREIAVREVELIDIWRLDEDDLRGLAVLADRIGAMLATTPHVTEAAETRNKVQEGVTAILTRQAEARISLVAPVVHIQAYETNLKALQVVKQHVGRMENLALASGLNPGDRLIGDDRAAAAPRREVHLPEAYGEAVVKITVQNTSPTLRRQISVQRHLPPEVMVEDVIDAGQLSVRHDAREQLTYVYADALEIGPMETLTFDVRIRDKWNVNVPRMSFLGDKINTLRMTTAGRTGLAAVDNMLNDAEAQLATLAQESGPDVFSPAYVAFYRRQADRLDAIERGLNRIDSALKPLETKRGFSMPAPDKRTTWLVIYAILGFLALISLLFFLRWFVKSA